MVAAAPTTELVEVTDAELAELIFCGVGGLVDLVFDGPKTLLAYPARRPPRALLDRLETLRSRDREAAFTDGLGI
jgi:hypothetical protein